MNGDLNARTLQISGADGDDIQAYAASPTDDGPRGGVVVIHHMPGYDRATKEITRRFAEMGYDAVCPNLYWRQAPDAQPDDAAAAVRATGGISDDQLVGDVGGAAAFLRGLPSSNGKVGVIGYCSGGRQSVLAACRLDLDAAVDCYGAYVTGIPPENWPLAVTPLYDDLPNLGSPMLGLFGNDDSYPSPDQVRELDQLLREHGKDFEHTSYDGAGHAFFAVDRPSYRPEAAVDGWQRIADFYDRHLSATARS
jgi:carboxymethylenebutenolidase